MWSVILGICLPVLAFCGSFLATGSLIYGLLGLGGSMFYLSLIKELGNLFSENAKIYAICPNWVNTESIREMNPEYLKSELERIGQKKLLEVSEVSSKVIEIIENEMPTGSIIVMEDSNDRYN